MAPTERVTSGLSISVVIVAVEEYHVEWKHVLGWFLYEGLVAGDGGGWLMMVVVVLGCYPGWTYG